jgi:Cys-rich protein (TIGR01571 family)
MQRVGLNWIGNPVPEEQAKKTFHTVFFLATTYVLFNSFYFPIVDDDNDEDDENVRMINLVWISLHQIIAVLAWIWSVWALTKTRAHVRSRDQIPEGQCHGCEDLCCALFCNCCTIAQLSRHTEEEEMAGRRRMLPRNSPVVGNVEIV